MMSANDAQPIIWMDGVTKRFGPVTAVNSVTLKIHAGEFFALLGPSGCGKTTLLRILAGLEIPDAGTIVIDGQEMRKIPANRRPVNMVFQSYAVFPHMSVLDNVSYGLKVTGAPSGEIRTRAEDALALVKLDGYGARMPDQLSGGQRQRVALARALVKRPKVLLLDEPLSALDAKLREAMRLELVNLQESVGITFVMVTHDQEEALSMANRIAVIDGGGVCQVASPAELYEFPANRFVADFIGSVNLFEGIVTGVEGSSMTVAADAFSRPLRVVQARTVAEGTRVWVGLRPEKISIAKRVFGRVSACETNQLNGVVEEVTYLGGVSVYHVRPDADGTLVKVTEPNINRFRARAFSWEDQVTLSWEEDSAVVLDS